MDEMTIHMSAEDLRSAIRDAVREGFADVGLHVEDADRVEEARADMRFLRHVRMTVDGIGIWIARTILTAVVGGLASLLVLGAKEWVVK